MNEKKSKALRRRIKRLQVEWLQSILPEEQGNTITVDNVEGLLPEQTHTFGEGKLYLSFMSDKWVSKMLKRYPNITTYKQLMEKHGR